MSRISCEEFAALIKIHLRSTEWLASYAWAERIMIFKMRPKHHYLLHLAADVEETFLNPKMFHNFSEESYLGQVKYLARKCHARKMSLRVLQRWLIAMAGFLKNRSA